jgi:8-oxo-dGTP pyrophosphatase MutT (NUDIX family)
MELRKFIATTIREYLIEQNKYNNHITCVISLFYNDKLLIVKRGSTAPWMPNKWSLVGGVLDDDESETETIIRETKEEIGLTPKNVKLIKTIKTNDSGKIVYFIGYLNSNNINLDYENQDYRFISINEIDTFEFVPYVKDFIEYSFKKNKKDKVIR